MIAASDLTVEYVKTCEPNEQVQVNAFTSKSVAEYILKRVEN